MATPTEYPLSPNQQGLWALEQRFPGQGLYNLNGAYRLPVDISPAALRRAADRVSARHPALRTTFSHRNGIPFQIVHDELPPDFREVHVENGDKADWEEVLGAQASHPLDLEQGPLVRWVLIVIRDQRPILSLIIHHIITDGWSNSMIFAELATLYQEEIGRQTANLSTLKHGYHKFIQQQVDWLASPDGEKERLFWREKLFGHIPMLDLPTDRTRRVDPSFMTECLSFAIPATLQESMRKLAKEMGVRPLTVWLSAWFVFLHHLTWQEDLVTTIPVAGRSRKYIGVAGFFVNALPVRVHCAGEETFQVFLTHVADIVEDVLTHQNIPRSLMVQGTDQDTHAFLLRTSFAWQDYNIPGRPGSKPIVTALGDMGEIFHAGGIGCMEWELVQYWHSPRETDIQLWLMNLPDNQYGIWQYASDLFDHSTIERWSGHFLRLLEGIIAEPETKISQLPLLTEAERHRILLEWNDTQTPYPQDKCVHELFEEQAARNSDAIAVVFEDEEVNYGELNARANRLAHRLRALGVGPEALVGLFVERSVDMIVGLLAILKAGGAYVPLDPSYPADRLTFLAGNARLTVLLSHMATRPKLSICHSARILDMDAEAAAIAEERSDNPERLAGPDNLAYVIYTSGSTGKPKGVMVEHKNLSHYTSMFIDAFDIQPRDKILQSTPISFDASVRELFPLICSGGQIVICRNPRELDVLFDDVLKHQISILCTSPYVVGYCNTRANELISHGRLRVLLSRGDVLQSSHILNLHGKLPLYNAYGPTEATVNCLQLRIEKLSYNIPIGRPVKNTNVHVLDAHMNLVPIGVPGELYIGGAGVARGYLNRPELTAKRFLPDPFSNEFGDGGDARLYRTGDLCRWLPDGTIEFLGRIDTQVKIRGFRIECGEVENALLSHPDVREAVVDARGEGTDKQLVAWVVVTDDVVGATGRSPLRDELRTHLRGSLPDWMAPSRFVFVEFLPLTLSGKIDRKALPAPDESDLAGQTFVVPISPTEELLAELWSAVLKRETIGRFDNFFHLGGHSLLATQLISRIRDSFQVTLPVGAVFEHPELSALAGAIESAMEMGAVPDTIEPAPRDGGIPLSFAQEQFWLYDQVNPAACIWNMAHPFLIRGELDVPIFKRSFEEIIHRHESLRTTFHVVDGGVVQRVSPRFSIEIPVIDLRGAPEKEQFKKIAGLSEKERQTPFDLAHGPLLRLTLIRLAEDSHVLLLCMHHIIMDGASLEILIRELTTLYESFISGQPSHLPVLPIQYPDFAYWQRQSFTPDRLEAGYRYWEALLTKKGLPILGLPTDKPRSAKTSLFMDVVSFQLSPELPRKLHDLSRRTGTTPSAIVFTAFAILLYRYSGSRDIIVETIFANRNREELNQLIGCFASMSIVRIETGENPVFADLLVQVQKGLISAMDNQTPFEHFARDLQLERYISHKRLSPVWVNYFPAFTLEGGGEDRSNHSTANNITITPWQPQMRKKKVKGMGDLALEIIEKNTSQGAILQGIWLYKIDLFDEETIVGMEKHFQTVLEAVTTEPGLSIDEISL